MIEVQVLNTERVAERLRSLPQRVRQRLRAVIGEQTIELRTTVLGSIGALFKSGTGRLARSIASEMQESTDDVGSRVYSSGVPYAGIQEHGGTTPPHLILPKAGNVLAFMGKDGKMVFARRVNHPGSHIPERSYMRSSLAVRRLEIVGAIRGAVTEAVVE